MKRQFYVTQYAAIFDAENRLLLLRDATEKQTREKWVFPGGHIDADTNAVDALAREIREETSLKLKAAWVFKTELKKYPDGNWKYVVYYVCQAKGKVRLSKEHDALEWVDLKKVRKMKLRDRGEKELIIDLLERKKK